MGKKSIILVILTLFFTGLLYGCVMKNNTDNTGPTCTVTAQPNNGIAPLLVTFTFTTTVTKENIGLWKLDTNNDSTPDYQGSGHLPLIQQHIYQDPGTFTATFTITDKNGIVATTSIIIMVYEEQWQPLYNVRYPVTVTNVIDGDTLDALFPNGAVERVRLLGIDTPEINPDSNKPHEYDGITDLDCLGQWGLQSKYVTIAWIKGKDIFIEFDETAGLKTGERWLCYVYLENGTDFCALLLKKGYARAYMEGTCSKEYYYFLLQQHAMDKGIGLWSCMEITEGLNIVLVHYDAGGNDEDNLNDEYVVIKNHGDSGKNLSGWMLGDEHGHVYTFPYGFVLAPDASVIIHTGGGTHSSKDLYWGNKNPIWNNNHDSAYLWDLSGLMIDSWDW